MDRLQYISLPPAITLHLLNQKEFNILNLTELDGVLIRLRGGDKMESIKSTRITFL